MNRVPVCVTGIGVATSLGFGTQSNWAALTQGKSGIKAIRRFDTQGLRATIGGLIDADDVHDVPYPVRTERLAHTVIYEALAQSGLPAEDLPGPLFVGMPPVEMTWPQRLALTMEIGGGRKLDYPELIASCSRSGHQAFHQVGLQGATATRLAESFGTRGAPVVVNTACSTGATILQLGTEAIRRGECDLALVVASDVSVAPETIIRFSLLAALSTSNEPPEAASRPFSLDRDGFVLGEGAAALVLENYARAKARGQPTLGFITGLGESADRYHLTRSSPDGSAIIAAIRSAIDDSGLAPEDIHYVNAHGTGTPENDRMECLALERVFKEYVRHLPVSSNKSMIGHTLSAAGAIESIFSLLTIATQTLPPTINYRVPDPALPLDVVPNAARRAVVHNVLSNSFGFGGQNVCLILSGEPTSRSQR
jgi:3-oxoacyl-[acyl-carrier-protein] synthase II